MKIWLLPVALVVLLGFIMPLTAQEDAEANKALALRYVEEVFNVNNTDLVDENVDEILAEELEFHTGAGDWSKTFLVSYFQEYHSHGLVETYMNPILVSEGDLVTVLSILDHERVTFKAVMPSIIVMRIDDGLIAEMWEIRDDWFLRQSLVSSDEDAVTLEWFPVPGTSETTVDENRTLAASAVDLWQTGEIDGLPEIYADDLVFHPPAGISTEPLDRDGLARYIAWLRTAMPDLSIMTEGKPVLAEGDLVVHAYEFTGSIMPEGATQPRSVKAQGIDVYRIADGKIAEVWWHWQPQSIVGGGSVLLLPYEASLFVLPATIE